MGVFKYTAQTPQEIQEEQEKFLLQAGTCRWELLKSSPEVASTGNNMFKLKIRVTDKNGKQAILFDNLIDLKNMQWKTRHFLESAGFSEKYETEELDSDWIDGCGGLCEVVTKFDSTYGKQSKIKDYLPPLKLNSNGDLEFDTYKGNFPLVSEGESQKENPPLIDDDIGF